MFISIIIFIFTLLILVLIHEFGHFILAKKFSIKVEEFGFGIPPRAWGKKIGETVYSINWLPFGGFVKLLGEDEVDTVTISTKGPNLRDFRAKTVGQRIAVVAAGVTMNLLLAWVLFYAVIIGQNFHIIYPVAEPAVFIAGVEKDFPAQEAGIKSGEKLIALDDQNITSIEGARNLIKSKDGPMTLTLSDIDGNNLRQVSVTPRKVDDASLIGVIFSPIPFKEYQAVSQKIFSGITYSWDLTRLTVAGLGKLFVTLIFGEFGQASKSVSGPVGLAVLTNDILSSGSIKMVILPYLWFVGVISLTLSIFNVLPIPALDGGRLLFLAIEAVIRKKIKADTEKLVHQIGFAVLITLALLVTYSDIRKLLP